MSFEIEGAVHKIFETENKTDSFQAREFVIKTDGQYPQFIKFQLTQDRCPLVDGFKEGEMMKVHFDLRGREWNEKYFTNLNAWRIEKSTAGAAMNAPPAPEPTMGNMPQSTDMPTATDTPKDGANESFDDLPF